MICKRCGNEFEGTTCPICGEPVTIEPPENGPVVKPVIPPPAPPKQQSSGLAVASLVLGIISLVLVCFGLGFLGIIGFLLGLISLICKKPGHGMAIAGIITSVIAFLLTLIVGASLFSVFKGASEEVKPYATTAAVTSTVTAGDESDSAETADGAEETTEEESTGPQVFGLGDSVQYKDIIVSFNNLTESEGGNYVSPADGNIFLLAEFTIENNSSDDLIISSLLSFKAYQDGYTLPSSFSATMASGSANQLDGTIAPGKKMNGIIGFEVPKDYQELEIDLQLDVLSSTKMVFVYHK